MGRSSVSNGRHSGRARENALLPSRESRHQENPQKSHHILCILLYIIIAYINKSEGEFLCFGCSVLRKIIFCSFPMDIPKQIRSNHITWQNFVMFRIWQTLSEFIVLVLIGSIGISTSAQELLSLKLSFIELICYLLVF